MSDVGETTAPVLQCYFPLNIGFVTCRTSVIVILLTLACRYESGGRSDFTCNIGMCIPHGILCDGNVDCPDGSDEDYTTCSKLTQYRTKSR